MSTFQPDIIVPHKWIGVDFNRTLAEYHSYHDDMLEAKPLAPMVERVKQWLAEGKTVKILSAQVWTPPRRKFFGPTENQRKWIEEAAGYDQRANIARGKIQAWCLKHLDQELEVTCERDPGCQEVWDDKARQVMPNTGLVQYEPRGHGPFTMWEETGPWPPAENVMGWAKGNMSGMSTFSDAEIERTYWKMMARRGGLIVADDLTPAAQSLLAYTQQFHKPPTCVYPHPDSATDISAQPHEAPAYRRVAPPSPDDAGDYSSSPQL